MRALAWISVRNKNIAVDCHGITDGSLNINPLGNVHLWYSFFIKLRLASVPLKLFFTSPLEYWMQVERMQVGPREDFKAWAMLSDPYYR